MPSEIKQLLDRIEQEHLAARRGLYGLASVARHDFITARQKNIDACHARLPELIGGKATAIVAEVLENADLLYEAEAYRSGLQELHNQEGRV